jgi:hypothetical protein
MELKSFEEFFKPNKSKLIKFLILCFIVFAISRYSGLFSAVGYYSVDSYFELPIPWTVQHITCIEDNLFVGDTCDFNTKWDIKPINLFLNLISLYVLAAIISRNKY